VADQPQQAAEAAERDAESAELYAPPGDDKALPSDPFPARPAHSPGLVGFVALLFTSALCSAIAAGFMGFWYNITPIKSGFLSGLEETILAFLGWAALSMFALLCGILLAAGILGRDGKVAPFAWALTVVLAILAALVCFIPEPRSTFVARGLLGLFSEAITLGLTMIVLRFARRTYIGPPPPPPWMAG
jgi:hypothetical protein